LEGSTGPYRLALARCLLGRGLGAEALATLDGGVAAGPSGEVEKPAARALRAVADILLGRTAAADALLASLPGPEDAELRLWRALAAFGAGDDGGAWAELQRSDGVLDRYPQPLRRRVGPSAARIALAAGAPDAALAILAGLRNLDLTPSEKTGLDLLEAESRSGTAPAAVPESLLKPAIAAGDWRIATEAAFQLTAIRERAGRITAETARRELETQRLLWRGHPDEFTMLRYLLVLELRAGQPAKAAESLGMLLDRRPSKRGASSGEDPSPRLFLALARAGRSDAAIAISALAIYRRHPELLSAAERDEALPDLAQGLEAAGLEDSARTLADNGAGPAVPRR
jgi:hypothetical protein